MRAMGVVAVLAAIVGCATGAADGSDGACELADGVYLQRFVRRSGDCGPIDDQLVRYDGTGDELDPGCIDRSERSEDLCSKELDRECVTPKGRFQLVGKLRMAADERWSGTLSLSIQVDGDACTGIYAVTVTPQ